jgi:UDP-N-acetylglucosamine--N-acetylmuramyl-(pentapeptide) pyrophosphoryl-undecaprenol N-acetylglucosamine transferase
VTEIAAVGLPAVFVPLPTAADDHQTTNATAFKEHNGCIVVQQSDFTPEKLAEILVYMLNNPQYMSSLSDNIKKVAITDADIRLADIVEKTVHGD